MSDKGKQFILQEATGEVRRLILATLIPFAAFLLQWCFWETIQPYVWFLFYPAVFFSSWIGGLRGGLAATGISVAMVWWFFIPVRFSFVLDRPVQSTFAIGIFTGMGVLFSLTHERLRKANQRAADALDAVTADRDHLEERVRERTNDLARTVDELSKSHARLKKVLQVETVGVMFWDLTSGCLVDANDTFLDLMGYSRRDVEARELTWQKLTPPEYFEQSAAEVRKFLATGRVGPYEKEYLRKDGTRNWFVFAGSSLGDNACVEFCVDISDRKNAEAALRKSEEEFRSLAEAMPQIVWATRPDGGNIYFNRQWVEYTGLTLEESYGPNWIKPFHPEDQPRAWTAWERATKYIDAYSLECRLRRADGVYRWWLIRGVPFCNDKGEILKWFGTCTDIDDMKQANEEIRRLNEDLEQRVQERTADLEAANRELDSFAYAVSHDLKAPLRGIDGYSRLLEEDYRDRLDEEARLFLRNIRAGTGQMHQLIEDLLNYSRMERRSLQSVPLNLSALVKAVAAEQKSEEQAGIQFSLQVPSLMVRADREGLAVVLRNLLENAVKFSRHAAPPTVSIGARQEEEKAILWVRDNGIGFDMRFHDRIFEIFQRLQRVEEFPGTGVGLALVRKAMQRMGGRVWAESAPGEGATFYLEIPYDNRVAQSPCPAGGGQSH